MNKNKNNKANIFIMAVYIILTFLFIYFHEQWRDEAQAWLIARDLSFTGIISQLKYEGHFLIWYLILMPFAKMGLPFITTNIISTILVCASVWIILTKSPLKPYQKGLFIFSAPMLYLYPTISRSYALIPLAISLAAWFYKDRKDKPIRYILAIALLANTHVIMLGMVGILLLDFYLEQFLQRKDNTKEQNKKIALSLIIVSILLALSALPLLGALNTNQTVGNLSTISLDKIIYAFSGQLINILTTSFSQLLDNTIWLVLIVTSTILLIFFGIIKSWKRALEFYIILLWQSFVYTCIYPMSFQRANSIIFIILFFIWTGLYSEKKENSKTREKIFEISFAIFMILNIISGVSLITLDINGNYSTSKQVADYIEENLPKDSVIILGSQPEFASPIAAHTKNVKYYYIQSEDYFTFATWDKANIQSLDENFDINSLKGKFDTENLYYLYPLYKFEGCSNDLQLARNLLKKEDLSIIFQSDEDYFSYEQYILFEIK